MDNITSRTIERLRFPMTVLVLFIHVLPFAASQGGIEYTFPFNTDSWSHRFIYFFNWIFPRVAVPMFCIISGYLFFQGLNTVDCFKEKYKLKLKSRVKTLLIPYLLLNIIFEIWRLFMISSDKLELLPKSFFLLCKEIFNSFWGMYAPSDAPLWYVRDLMAVMVLAPIIFFVINKCGKYVVIVLTFIWLLGLWPRLPIVPGIDIILFVTWGAYFAMKGIEPFRKMASLTGYWPVYIISLLWAVWEYDELAYNFPIRLSILLGLSLVSALFLYIDKHIKNVPKILTASSFFTYCLHWIYVAPLTSCVVFMIQPESEITVVLIYFACIFLTLIISLLSFLILRILSPRLLLLFTGSRG